MTRVLSWVGGILIALAMIPFLGVVAIFVVAVLLFVAFCCLVAGLTGNLNIKITEKDQ